MNTETVKEKSTNALSCERGRRGRQDIIMCILKIAEYGSSRARMIDKLNLSSAQCKGYLVDLKTAGYIVEDGRLWKTTNKGLQVIDACKNCQDLMDSAPKTEK